MTTYNSKANREFVDQDRRINERVLRTTREYAKISNEQLSPLSTQENITLVNFQGTLNRFLVNLSSATSSALQSRKSVDYIPSRQEINIVSYMIYYNNLASAIRRSYMDPQATSVMKTEIQRLLPYLQLLKDYYYARAEVILPKVNGDIDVSIVVNSLIPSLRYYNLLSLMYSNINTGVYSPIDQHALDSNQQRVFAEFGPYTAILNQIYRANPSLFGIVNNVSDDTEEFASLLERTLLKISTDPRASTDDAVAEIDRLNGVASDQLPTATMGIDDDASVDDSSSSSTRDVETVDDRDDRSDDERQDDDAAAAMAPPRAAIIPVNMTGWSKEQSARYITQQIAEFADDIGAVPLPPVAPPPFVIAEVERAIEQATPSASTSMRQITAKDVRGKNAEVRRAKVLELLRAQDPFTWDLITRTEKSRRAKEVIDRINREESRALSEIGTIPDELLIDALRAQEGERWDKLSKAQQKKAIKDAMKPKSYAQ